MPQRSPDPDGFTALEDIDAEEENAEAAAAEQQKQADLEKATVDQAAKDKEDADQKALDDKAAEDAKAKEDEAASAADDVNTDDADGSFWEDVDKLRGEALEVDFGDVDPNTPEGALVYEKAVRADEVTKFEEYIKETNPRAYAFMEHIMSGGKEEDFFKLAGDPLTLPTQAELEKDVDLQKQVLTEDYKSKGLSDKAIAATIKALITDDELEEAATEALKNRAKAQEDGVKVVQENTKREEATRTAKIQEMNDYISGVVNTGKIDNIIIPEKDRVPFAQALASSIRIENGQFVSVTPITDQTAADVFKEKFFSFKKGNISDLIEKAAATANTKRLIRSIPAGGKKPLGNGEKREDSITTMGDMED